MKKQRDVFLYAGASGQPSRSRPNHRYHDSGQHPPLRRHLPSESAHPVRSAAHPRRRPPHLQVEGVWNA
jgi:hypothetical protein